MKPIESRCRLDGKVLRILAIQDGRRILAVFQVLLYVILYVVIISCLNFMYLQIYYKNPLVRLLNPCGRASNIATSWTGFSYTPCSRH